MEDITGSLTGHPYVLNNARLFCPLSLTSHPVDIFTSYLDKDVVMAEWLRYAENERKPILIKLDMRPPHAPPCFLVEAPPGPPIPIICGPPRPPHQKIVQGGPWGGLGGPTPKKSETETLEPEYPL